MSITREVVVGNKTIKFEFNKYAKQANGSLMISCGDTQVLVTVCAADEAKEGQEFFPLTVDYIEKFYAAGRIPGGFVKRETKPSDRETLTARVIDRPLRPCFPEGYMAETQVVCTVMSVEEQHHPASLAVIGASTALMISDIPFNGPVVGLRIGLRNGEYILDPTEMEEGLDLDLNIAAKPDAILMVEAGANFLSEGQMLDAIDHAHNLMKPLYDFQYQIQKEIGKPKRKLPPPAVSEELQNAVDKLATNEIKQALVIKDKKLRGSTMKAISSKVKETLNADKDGKLDKQLNMAMETVAYQTMRAMVLDDRRRIDGRAFDEIRPIMCEIRPLKRPHGSALFQRGETQSLSTITLGTGEDEQRLDSILTPNVTKRFMLHYNFPPYSVGEARPLRSPGRREIGHGALAERALEMVIPPPSKFNYTIRLVSEILESNGSSSMATVCAGTMAMLSAGVPIKEPVAGIAMGLIKTGEKYAILSDILGDEDHLGDMDFKVCGGEKGITALQMDIKIDGLPRQIMAEALEQARKGRQHILKKIIDAINQPSELSEFAPRIFQLKIKEEKIRDLIGPGGKTIKRIVAETGVKIDIEDDGTVNIVAPDAGIAEQAKKIIRSVTSDPEVGAIYMGKVKRIVDFGAFVEIRPGLEGLLHISQLEDRRIEKVTDVLKEGEDVLVKILEVDRQGKIKLSRKEALDKKPTV